MSPKSERRLGPFRYANEEVALRGLMSSGPCVNVARQVGEEAVGDAIRDESRPTARPTAHTASRTRGASRSGASSNAPPHVSAQSRPRPNSALKWRAASVYGNDLTTASASDTRLCTMSAAVSSAGHETDSLSCPVRKRLDVA